jgi:RluA family pseudouridine synthase
MSGLTFDSRVTMKNQFVNISAYKFVPLDDIAALKAELLPFCKSLDLKGTILLSHEGINMFVAGTRESIDRLIETIELRPEFQNLPIKESFSDHQPFSRMLVRLKKEIISMGVEQIVPANKTSPKMTAAELKQWLDEGKEFTLLDVRNDYEVEVGTFEKAIPIGVDHFRKFPEATKSLPDEIKEKPIVMFCTGGIRCEKAGPLMEEEGFKEIYQLDGGILRYFELVGGDHYDGDCFVFDKRVAVDPNLEETETTQCYACQSILSLEDQASPHYNPPNSCPVCFQTEEQKMADLVKGRTALIAERTAVLPGSEPYNNMRPMNVPLRFERTPCLEFLFGMHSHLKEEYWRQELEQGRILHNDRKLQVDTEVRAGWRVEHLVPQTTEPDVNNNISVIYEDDALVVVNKPAPLPMHACGRFNRNSLSYMLGLVYTDDPLRITHRLDANTTGVVVFCKKGRFVNGLHDQFSQGTVEKTYLALVDGNPETDQFQSNEKISLGIGTVGMRKVDPDGLEALTEFKVIRRISDQDSPRTLLACFPKTGRTNQIRIHLASLQLPIVGDPTYVSTDSILQTKHVEDDPMCLHAWKVKIDHPSGGHRIEFEAEIPDWGVNADSNSVSSSADANATT